MHMKRSTKHITRKGCAWILLIAMAALMLAFMCEAARAEETPRMAMVNAWNVNFRTGPGKEHRVCANWSRGVRVQVLGAQDGWVQVLHWTSPHAMWVWHEYLTLDKP